MAQKYRLIRERMARAGTLERSIPSEDVRARHSSSPWWFRLFPSGDELSPVGPSWYYSARIQRMMEQQERGQCSSAVESEIEASKSHWSEVDPAMSQTEHSGEENRNYFEFLRRSKYKSMVSGHGSRISEITRRDFFTEWGDEIVVGEKLAEGGQAEIFAATHRSHGALVVKVFKGGSVLQDLAKQWPPALSRDRVLGRDDPTWRPLPMTIRAATLLKDESFSGRFAFVMDRAWGDLRKLIDLQMMNQFGPPFALYQALGLMRTIALDMMALHMQDPPILHKDLKAANALVQMNSGGDGPCVDANGKYLVRVADYECSVGVVGTGLWRAPEILQQLKDKVPTTELVFTEKCDVYSYGMTCYELVSGRIPFEDYECRPREGRELVLKGKRPELPPSLDPLVKKIISSCWHRVPSRRPSFENIVKMLRAGMDLRIKIF